MLEWQKIRTPTIGAVGAGSGLVASDLPAEFTARLSKQTGYRKAAVKSLVKIVIGTIFLAGGKRARTDSWQLALQSAAFASYGSIVLDWIAAHWPGGVPGIASSLAIMFQTWSVGATVANDRLTTAKAVAALQHEEQPIASTPRSNGRY